MDYQILKTENFKVSNWTGGQTTQLAIFPENGDYLKRDFVWRLSTATCDKEETNFSRLPDFDRVLMVLSGNVVLAHQDVRVARLNELEQDRFDGGYSTKSFGKITDYNLMVSKGNQGLLDVITLKEESQTPEIEDYDEYSLATQAYFCRDGYATVTINGNTVMLTEGQQLVINYERGENLDVSLMGEGHLVRAQIYYNYRQGEMGPTVIPAEKATLEDFKTCVYIANTQFRGAKYIFKKLKTQWYDEKLSSAIKKIDGVYLPYIICMIGICSVAFIFSEDLGGTAWLLPLLAWLLIDIFLVSPLLYFLVVPKPTAAHIKDISNLTPYEQGVRERELGTNERMDKLLKKYKNSGKTQYREEDD